MSDAAYQAWHDEPAYATEVAAAVPAGRLVLDLGGGTGWLRRHLPDDVFYVLCEAEGAARVAKQRVPHVVAADLTRPLPFATATVDVIVLKDVLEHLLSPLGLVQECARILTAAGAVFVSVPMPTKAVWDDYTHVRPFTRRGITRLIEDGGLQVRYSRVESVLPGVGHWARSLGSGRRPRVAHYVARAGLGARNAVLVAERRRVGPVA